MKIHNTEIKFKPGECYDMDREEHTLTLNLWQWDQIIDALRERRKRQEGEYRRYRELRKLQDWTSLKKIIQGVAELEHQINCELQYQIEGKHCDKCQAQTEKLVTATEAFLYGYTTKELLEGRHMVDEHYEQLDHDGK